VLANGCLPAYDYNISREYIKLANRNIDGVIKLKRAHVIVLGTTWSGDASESAGLDRTIDLLIAAGKKVVLIGPIASPQWDVASNVSRNLAFGRSIERPLYSSLQDFQSKYMRAIAHFEQRSDIEFVQPHLVQCQSAAAIL
jgi:hypothetical protein